jgi:hypothetical protein
MGWKQLKEHYGIKHVVHVRKGMLLIGSEYCLDLIQIGPEGEICVNSIVDDKSSLGQLVSVMRGEPDTVRRLMAEPDQFAVAIPVYSVVDGVLVKQLAESMEWPSVTHDGELMYENTHFATPETALREAKNDLDRSIEYLGDRRQRLLSQIDEVDSKKQEFINLRNQVEYQLKQVEVSA